MEKLFSVIVFLGLAFLFLKMSNSGIHNVKVANENKEIREISLKRLALDESLEVEKWVKIQGNPITNVSTKKEYIILADLHNKIGLFVKVANANINHEKSDTLTIKGMAKEVEQAPIQFKNELIQDLKIANVVIEENNTPPGWWGSWGKTIFNFFLLLGTLGSAAGTVKSS